MTKKIRKYYHGDNIRKTGAKFKIIYGERSNGKSFDFKHFLINEYLQNNYRFILMRRFVEELKSDKVEQYFMDVDIYKLTNGKYSTVKLSRGKIYFANFDIDAKPQYKIGEYFAYIAPLSTEQNFAGGSYLDVKYILFEEFMTRSVYLNAEPTKLMNFYCTIDRKRDFVELIMIGNSISRVCPYIPEWGLHKIISRQKQGTIEMTKQATGSVDDDGNMIYVDIAIEYCEDSGTSSFTIGKNKDMLNSGSWQTNPQPHLPKSKKEYECAFKIGFQYTDFRFMCELLLDKSDDTKFCWFIYPYNKEFNKYLLVFSDIVKISRLWQRNIYDFDINNDLIEKLLYNTFRESNIFYCDDLTGTDFKQVIDFQIKK